MGMAWPWAWAHAWAGGRTVVIQNLLERTDARWSAICVESEALRGWRGAFYPAAAFIAATLWYDLSYIISVAAATRESYGR